MRKLREIISEELPFFFGTPALIWQGLFLYLPLTVMICFSFLVSTPDGFAFSVTFSNYLRVLKPVYLGVIINSFLLALATSIVTLLIGYPLAYFLAVKAVKRWKTILLFLIILPSWTNFIIQVYAWFFLLEANGFINQLLIRTGMIVTPIKILNTVFATLIGMAYCFLPFMVLPIYSVLERMDKKLIESSADLGANRYYTFRKVVLPLSMPGIYSGFLLVFIPAFGEYAVPTLLGGSKQAYWGSVIVDKFLVSRDWASGFALAWSGISFIVLVLFLFITFAVLHKKIFSRGING